MERRLRPPRPFRLRAVVFDFDGTLTRPGALDFPALKRRLGCPPDRYLLEWIAALPPGPRREAAFAALEEFELEGARASEPNPGAEDLVLWLRRQGLGLAVLTRNGAAAVAAAFERFPRLRAGDFDLVLTRDDGLPPKPAPDGVLHAARALGADPSEVLVVGDYGLDVEAGRAAGALTVLLTNGAPAAAHDVEAEGPGDAAADFVAASLSEVREVVRLGLPLPPGKLPPDLLASHLAGLAARDPAVLLPPGLGEDVAALDIGGEEVLVVHGDPVTLTGHGVARWAVDVNLNDLAVSGARPRWLLATVLLPPGTTASAALCLLADLAGAAAASGLSLVGGHTEVTDTVTRPLVSLTAMGTVARDRLLDKRRVEPGDDLVLTRALAVEGTALLAVELADELRAAGLGEDELEACRALAADVSVAREALAAAALPGVHAVHDVTEGGLAAAVRELAAATGHGITVEREAVPVLPQTRRVCDALAVDPLGLIASGSLLVCCRPEATPRLREVLAGLGVPATVIGRVGEPGAGVSAREAGRPAPWPWFDTDEAARLLAGRGER